VAFPALHGVFGEDGQLARVLERAGVPFVGSASAACAVAFHKRSSHLRLHDGGFPVLAQEALAASEFLGEDLTARFLG